MAYPRFASSMSIPPASPRLDTQKSIDWHLDRLVEIDPRLAAIRARTGTPSPRITAAGFPGIAKIVVGQQVSVASARAIWGRFELLDGALDPVRYLALE